ncbi:hypothetical protein SSS_03069 [Sarcoptes scabiei]|uniref:Uncharacterized protein n=1 Tax=Sarcoptes scabiei TaxID=52283 RepID=A0A834REX1_SARSC|nr:hypothetical protein SSS_03069 [Sarcoptes scabiei]
MDGYADLWIQIQQVDSDGLIHLLHRRYIKYIKNNAKSMEKKSPKKSLRFGLRRKVTEKKSPIWFTEKSHREKVSDLVYGEKSPRKSLRKKVSDLVYGIKSPI